MLETMLQQLIEQENLECIAHTFNREIYLGKSLGLMVSRDTLGEIAILKLYNVSRETFWVGE